MRLFSIIILLAGWSANAAETFSPASPSTNADGLITYTVTSSYNAPATTVMRVLIPPTPSNLVHKFVISLPVEPEPQSTYGIGIEYIRTNNLHNSYNCTIVEPQFQGDSWDADGTDLNKRYESFIVLGVVPWILSNLSTLSGNESVNLIGFSKSGFGVFTLITRNPNVFRRAAPWDFPAQQIDYNGFGAGANYGSQGNFDSNYRLYTSSSFSTWLSNHVSNFQTLTRIWLSYDTGYNSGEFRNQVQALGAAMNTAGWRYQLNDPGSITTRGHVWTSGWVTNAFPFIGADDVTTIMVGTLKSP